MKVYTSVTIDVETLEVVEERFFHYEGKVVECKGGGGGGAAGQVDYPDYMETFHQQLLDDATADALDSSIVDVINTATGASPFSGALSYDPDTALDLMDGAVFNFDGVARGLNPVQDWDTSIQEIDSRIDASIVTAPTQNTPTPNSYDDIIEVFDKPIIDADEDITGGFSTPTPSAHTDIDGDYELPVVASEAEISAHVDAFEAIADDHVTTDVLPRFQAGMSDINAVSSSSFTLGQAVIEGMTDRDVSKFQGDLRSAVMLQADQINAGAVELKNKLKGESRLAADKIDSEAIIVKNKALASAYTAEDALEVEMSMTQNKLVGDAYMQEDRILAASTDAKNTINAEMEKVRRGIIVSSVDRVLSNQIQKVEFEKAVMHYTAEANRIRIVAKKEETDQQLSIDENDGLWDLNAVSYGGNMLASIGGAVSGGGQNQPSPVQSAIGGALSGAASGAMMGSVVPGLGTTAGAVIGGIAGLFSSI